MLWESPCSHRALKHLYGRVKLLSKRSYGLHKLLMRFVIFWLVGYGRLNALFYEFRQLKVRRMREPLLERRWTELYRTVYEGRLFHGCRLFRFLKL